MARGHNVKANHSCLGAFEIRQPRGQPRVSVMLPRLHLHLSTPASDAIVVLSFKTVVPISLPIAGGSKRYKILQILLCESRGV